MKQFICVPPSSIQIIPKDAAPIVAISNTIGIKHRYDSEDEFFSKTPCNFMLRENKIHHAFEYPRRIALSRMHATADYNLFFGILNNNNKKMEITTN